MGTSFCRGCGKQIDAAAAACPHCGAVQNAAAGTNGKPTYTSYDQVPWYRKNWFAILCAFFFMPGLWITLMTGDVYYESKGQLKTYSKGAKIGILVWSILVLISCIKNAMAGEPPTT